VTCMHYVQLSSYLPIQHFGGHEVARHIQRIPQSWEVVNRNVDELEE